MRTLEHNQTQFKLDTLVDWQPVKEITHRRGNAIVFAPADYQSSCGVKDSLQLAQMDVVYTGEDGITVVNPVDNLSINLHHVPKTGTDSKLAVTSTNLDNFAQFLPRDAYAQRGLCCGKMSVCPSVTSQYCV